jgi:MFS family permease
MIAESRLSAFGLMDDGVPDIMSSDAIIEEEHTPPDNVGTAVPASKWRRWLFAFDGYNLSTNMLFTSAIWVIYLASHGYSPLAIGLFEMTFHVAKLVAEVPTGIFADLLGRRKSLIVFCVLSALENLLFLVPTTPMITLSFVLSGISLAFRGGANEAMLWTIAGYVEPGEQSKRYSKLISRMFMLGLVGEIIGTASGGYLGHILQILPFICRAALTALGIVPLLLLPEQRAETSHRTNPWQHLGKGLGVVRRNPGLLRLLLLSGLTDSCWQTIYFYYQLYLHGLGFSLTVIGLVVAASTGSSFLFTALAPRVMHYLPERWLVPVFVLLEILGLLLMSTPQPILSLIGYLVFFQASVAVLMPAISTYINERSTEAQRATILSFQTGLFSAAMIVLFPLFGLGVSHVPYSIVYIWTLEALAIGSLAIYAITWMLHKRRTQR